MCSRGSGPRRAIVMGAAGRDFHDFLVALRDDAVHRGRRVHGDPDPGNRQSRTFPRPRRPALSRGHPDRPESRTAGLIARRRPSTRSLRLQRHRARRSDAQGLARAVASGADFRLLGPDATMVRSTKPVISVCAVRTGVGKSGISRRVFERLRDKGSRPSTSATRCLTAT